MLANAEKIKAKILTDAREEAERITGEARERAEQLLMKARDEASRLQDELVQKGAAEAAQRRQRALAMAKLEMRKQVLAAKQEIIGRSFRQAMAELLQSDDDSYYGLMVRLAAAAVETGKETIILNPRDRDRLGQGFIDRVNQEIAQRGLPGQLSLAEATASISGGFITRQGGVENNYSFDALFRLHREDLEPQVAEVLFPGQAGE